jgi:hypothetical protein
MRTSVSARTLVAALAVAFALNGAVQAAEPPSAPPQGATVRESQDSTLANTNANTARASSSAAAIPASTANYVPKTQYDNTPYRFNAGKRFTAAEFDAWMKSRGIRVAKGVPAAGGERPVAPAAAAAAPACGTAEADTSAC